MRRLFSLVIFMAVGAGSLWLYHTLTLVNPYDEVWIGINSRLPDPVRTWSCQTVRKRLTNPGPPRWAVKARAIGEHAYPQR